MFPSIWYNSTNHLHGPDTQFWTLLIIGFRSLFIPLPNIYPATYIPMEATVVTRNQRQGSIRIPVTAGKEETPRAWMDLRTPSGHNSDSTVKDRPGAEVNIPWSVTCVILI